MRFGSALKLMDLSCQTTGEPTFEVVRGLFCTDAWTPADLTHTASHWEAESGGCSDLVSVVDSENEFL